MRKFMLVMGMIFTGLLGVGIGSFGYVGALATASAESNKDSAVSLVHEVSRSWSLTGAREAFTNTALAHASTPAGRQALTVMSRLGPLTDVLEVSQTGYKIEFQTGTTATISFKGLFKNGTGDVTVVLCHINGRAKIVELNLKRISLRRQRQRLAAV